MNRILSGVLVAASSAAAAFKARLTPVAAVVVLMSATAMPASAATLLTTADITAGSFVTATEILAPGDDAEFRFTNIDNIDITISDIALAGTGNNGGADIGNVTFGFTQATMSGFSTVTVSTNGHTGTGADFISGLLLSTGDTFSIFWGDDGIFAPVGVTASFSTFVVPTTITTPVPLPAAGLMLIGALGALGFARRMRTS